MLWLRSRNPGNLPGWTEADWLSLDPHKWLYQPVDCGCLLYRDPAAARRAVSHTGDYASRSSKIRSRASPSSRNRWSCRERFRALKLWLSLRYHGFAKFREAIDNDLDNAQRLADLIRANSHLELLAPVPLSAVCFRYVSQPDAGHKVDALNQAILQRIVRRGKVFLSNATIQGKFALRACFVNHRTTPDDVASIVSDVLQAAAELGGAES